MKYKFEFSGFAYVEADSEEEAKAKYEDDDVVYSETNLDDYGEVPEFHVEI